jgi:hypothetical protein
MREKLNNKSIFLVVAAIVAAMASAVIPAAVYADSENGKSDFGEQASDNIAKDGDMGEHSSNPDDDETKGNDNSEDPGPDDNNHRAGIGNVFNEGDPKEDDNDDSKHPSDTANTLCDLFPTNEACTDEP